MRTWQLQLFALFCRDPTLTFTMYLRSLSSCVTRSHCSVTVLPFFTAPLLPSSGTVTSPVDALFVVRGASAERVRSE